MKWQSQQCNKVPLRWPLKEYMLGNNSVLWSGCQSTVELAGEYNKFPCISVMPPWTNGQWRLLLPSCISHEWLSANNCKTMLSQDSVPSHKYYTLYSSTDNIRIGWKLSQHMKMENSNQQPNNSIKSWAIWIALRIGLYPMNAKWTINYVACFTRNKIAMRQIDSRKRCMIWTPVNSPTSNSEPHKNLLTLSKRECVSPCSRKEGKQTLVKEKNTPGRLHFTQQSLKTPRNGRETSRDG